MEDKWNVKRSKPYTTRGIKRLKCIKCGWPATTQWQICADDNNYRPLCRSCDVGLNRLVLNWMEHPDAKQKSLEYAFRRIA